MTERESSWIFIYNYLIRYLKAGALLVVPSLITISILVFVWSFLSQFFNPLRQFIAEFTGLDLLLAELIVILSVLSLVIGLGFLVETIPHGLEAAAYFHSIAETIPGIGGVYGGFREMSQTIADGEESFRDVKMVEYPSEGAYTMAFVTADTPPRIEESIGHSEEGMVSLFLPMGPNPIMGGFVIYVSRDRVHDIDITVEEGLQAIVTSGITMSETDEIDIGAQNADDMDSAGSTRS